MGASETAVRAIKRSVSHNEIVTIDWTPDAQSYLDGVCIGSVAATSDKLEYWGDDENGDDWRVHLKGKRA